VPACTRAAEDGQNTSDECDSMHRSPLVGRRESCKVNVGSVVVVMAAPQLLALLTRVNLSGVMFPSTLLLLRTRCGPISALLSSRPYIDRCTHSLTQAEPLR